MLIFSFVDCESLISRPSIVPLVRLGESDQGNHYPLLKSKSPGGKAINWDRLNAEDA